MPGIHHWSCCCGCEQLGLCCVLWVEHSGWAGDWVFDYPSLMHDGLSAGFASIDADTGWGGSLDGAGGLVTMTLDKLDTEHPDCNGTGGCDEGVGCLRLTVSDDGGATYLFEAYICGGPPYSTPLVFVDGGVTFTLTANEPCDVVPCLIAHGQAVRQETFEASDGDDHTTGVCVNMPDDGRTLLSAKVDAVAWSDPVVFVAEDVSADFNCTWLAADAGTIDLTVYEHPDCIDAEPPGPTSYDGLTMHGVLCAPIHPTFGTPEWGLAYWVELPTGEKWIVWAGWAQVAEDLNPTTFNEELSLGSACLPPAVDDTFALIGDGTQTVTWATP